MAEEVKMAKPATAPETAAKKPATKKVRVQK
jgi:hypothetical protein